ncbi:MAG: CYTH domain-containing protein [Paludibacteraceae bacterium]|nr:CYTH domain-containing protein [Paludibacteraceae bacterium]
MPKNTEIERKFLVRGTAYQAQATRKMDICQAYLCREPAKTIRVRIAGEKAYLTIKSSAGQEGIARFEWEREIDLADAKQLLRLCLPGMIMKTRWIIPAGNGLKWEVDEFHGQKQGLVMAEIELEDEAQTFDRPEWLGEEVTGRPEYYNSNML